MIQQPAAAAKKITAGTATPTGTATTVVTIAHGLGSTPSFHDVRPGNLLSAALFYSTADATTITITYLSALTGLLSLNWMATE